MKNLLLVNFLMLLCFGLSAQTTHYVDNQASGANDGSSWSNAFTNLQDALTNANTGDNIWIKSGLYVPEGADTLSAVFTIDKPLYIYGGFAGTETDLSQRPSDGSAITELSGDRNGDDDLSDNTVNRTDNSRHVVFIDSLMTVATLMDGLTISHGNTSNSSDLSDYFTNGGGVVTFSPVALSNIIFEYNFGRAGAGASFVGIGTQGSEANGCVFRNNTATSQSAGLMIRNSSTIFVTDCVFEDNTTSRGALYPLRSDNINITNCTFINNTNPSGFGGALFSWNNTNMTVSDCTFNSNSSVNAGCAYIDGRELDPSTSENLTINNCAFNGNGTLDGFGGALYFYQMGYTMDNCTFNANIATGGSGGAIYNGGQNKIYSITNSSFSQNQGAFGGALVNYSLGTVGSIDNCTFSDNSAITSGGAAINGFLANVAYTNCSFLNNDANFAGAVFNQNDSTSVAFTNCIFQTNMSQNSGGAISTSSGVVISIDQADFTGNTAGSVGGAINVFESGGSDSNDMSSLSVSRATFFGNAAGTQGGAINVSNVDTDVESCLFVQNQAQQDGIGGGISVNAFDTTAIEVRVINSTFTFNEGALAGGISQWTNDTGETTLFIQNNIFDNPGYVNYVIEAGTPNVVSTGGNFITDGTFNSYLDATDQEVIGGDPMYTDFFNFDFSIQIESPCIDAGVEAGAPAVDILGNERVDGVDIGAYENQKETNTFEADLHKDLKLNPNPAQDFTQIQLDNVWIGEITIELTDLQGRVLLTEQAEKFNDSFQYELQWSNIKTGVYLVKLSHEGVTINKPLIIQ